MPRALPALPRAPLAHGSLALLGASDPGPGPSPSLHDVLLHMAEQHENLRHCGDNLRRELSAAQASFADLQASLQQYLPPPADGCSDLPHAVIPCTGEAPGNGEPLKVGRSECAGHQLDSAGNMGLRRPERPAPPPAGADAPPGPTAGLRKQRKRSSLVCPAPAEGSRPPAPDDAWSQIADDPPAEHTRESDQGSEPPGPTAGLRRQSRRSSLVCPAPAEGSRPPAPDDAQSQIADDPPAEHTRESDQGSEPRPSNASTSKASTVYADGLQQKAVYRLRARLGLHETRGAITAKVLADAVAAPALDTYDRADMERMIRAIRERADGDGFGFEGDTLVASSKSEHGNPGSSWTRPAGALASLKKQVTVAAALADNGESAVGVHVFAQALLSVDHWCDESRLKNQIHAVKEVLFSGDANKMVAELTQVRVDELAEPLPRSDTHVLEPAVGFMIVLNGILVGLQTDPALLDGATWMYVGMIFTLFFIFEVLLRIWSTGLRHQDREVQRLINELDIPPDRADLFDILDADSSGGLEVTELIQGFLRVRGETKKSDVIASLLATRALQAQFRRFSETVLTALGVAAEPLREGHGGMGQGLAEEATDRARSVELELF